MTSHPSLLSDSPGDRSESALLVVGFCAAWCNTCGEFRHTFDDLSARRPGARFVWLDIEDDAQVVGDIEIENFPTIAVFSDNRLVHFGVSLPQAAIVGRLIDSFHTTSKTLLAQEAIANLPGRLARPTPPAVVSSRA